MNTLLRSFLLAPLLFAYGFSAVAHADTLWTENAENGYNNVIDGTSLVYPLIQSNVVGQGANAFQLAHISGQAFTPNWFELDTTLPIEADTKLFFLSRLRYSGTGERARAQISTNGGSSWNNLYEQSGTNTPGEGVFGLKQIALTSYANQDARFRFSYEFEGGNVYYYDSNNPGDIGWFVDNIQIGDAFEKVPWSIGDPTSHEQQYLEYINRARADAFVEATRLRNEPDSGIQIAYQSFGIDGQDIVDQFQWYVNNGHMDRFAQPLSFQEQLLEAAQLHTLDLFQNQFQGHNSSGNPPDPFEPGFSTGQRATAVGYSWQNIAENVFSHSDSVAYGHAGFDVDWGNTTNPAGTGYNPAFNGQGMQNPAGHRRNIHNDDYKEIGIGVINGTNGSVGPQLVTQDFGFSGDVRYITGVVFDDLNDNNFYDIGEGRSGVRVDVDGSAFYAISSTSGGYSVPVPLDGTYNVAFSGGGFPSFTTSTTVAGGRNVKVDYTIAAAPFLAGDYNNDGSVNAADYTVYRNRKSGIGGSTLPYGDDTPGVGFDDYTRWKMHYGESNGAGASQSEGADIIPEPSTLVLMIIGAMLAGFFRRRSFDQAL